MLQANSAQMLPSSPPALTSLNAGVPLASLLFYLWYLRRHQRGSPGTSSGHLSPWCELLCGLRMSSHHPHRHAAGPSSTAPQTPSGPPSSCERISVRQLCQPAASSRLPSPVTGASCVPSLSRRPSCPHQTDLGQSPPVTLCLLPSSQSLRTPASEL